MKKSILKMAFLLLLSVSLLFFIIKPLYEGGKSVNGQAAPPATPIVLPPCFTY